MANREKTFTKAEVLELVKSINIEEMLIPEGAKRKWFRFGAHDALGMLSDKVNNL